MALVMNRAGKMMIKVGTWRQTASSSWRSTGYRPLTTTTTTTGNYTSRIWCIFEAGMLLGGLAEIQENTEDLFDHVLILC